MDNQKFSHNFQGKSELTPQKIVVQKTEEPMFLRAAGVLGSSFSALDLRDYSYFLETP